MLVMGYLHAHDMRTMLLRDIADQKEREEYYDLPMHTSSETVNHVRLQSARHLARNTVCTLIVCATASAMYTVSCMGLLYGVFRYRPVFLLPWLLMHGIVRTVSTLAVLYYQSSFMYIVHDSKVIFCK